MNLPVSLSASEVQKLANSGSPALLHFVGRAFGLGQSERNALATGGIPGWVWGTFGILGGIVIGIHIQKRWPKYVPNFISGEKEDD
jgi:hypothetical protein